MGAYTIDTETHVLSFRGCSEKTLGNTEFATLKLLWINKGEVVSRQDLKDTVCRGVHCSEESLNNVMYNLRSIGKQYKFSISPTIAMTKDLWRKIMDEVSVSEVI